MDFDYDLLVLCGDNKDVMEKIKKLKGKSKLSTYGMVEHIHELIATTDILITKAGGITTTECTKVGPCLLFANSIVGLEDKNEDFFISHNAALKFTKENARSVMSDLLSHPKKITEMRSNLKNIGKRKTAPCDVTILSTYVEEQLKNKRIIANNKSFCILPPILIIHYLRKKFICQFYPNQ
ncbi:unnamed protein product [marine sediment metagenome]|uniref:Glycosyl transferase family 28 C-terminal domain-containing protein n=1 Tax=marine sediment metagenome TaxID=412755 RepID=X1QQ19_9ZZZZ